MLKFLHHLKILFLKKNLWFDETRLKFFPLKKLYPLQKKILYEMTSSNIYKCDFPFILPFSPPKQFTIEEKESNLIFLGA